MLLAAVKFGRLTRSGSSRELFNYVEKLCGYAGRQPNVYDVRNYKVKLDSSNLTREEHFILRVLGHSGFKKIGKFELKLYVDRLLSLVKLGCKPYELAEYPQVLLLSKEELSARIEKLRLNGQEQLSIPLLKIAALWKTDAAVRRGVRNYLFSQNGSSNKIDSIKSALQCSDDDMLSLLTHNPRLVGVRQRKDIVEKIEFLLKNGARIEDLRRNTNLLNNTTLEVIKARTVALVAIGQTDPLPFGLLGRNSSYFVEKVAQLTSEQCGTSSPSSYAEEANSIISQLPPMTCHRLCEVKPKIYYLLSEGFRPEEILERHEILNVKATVLHSVVSDLKRYSLGRPTLDVCCNYAGIRRTVRSLRVVKQNLAKLLKCDYKALSNIPSNYYSINIIDEETMKLNRDFLYRVDFTDTDIRSVPLILMHAHEVVQCCWDSLIQPCNISPASMAFQTFRRNRMKQLNLLLYCIEKSVIVNNMDSSSTPAAEEADCDELTDPTVGVPLVPSYVIGNSVGEDPDHSWHRQVGHSVSLYHQHSWRRLDAVWTSSTRQFTQSAAVRPLVQLHLLRRYKITRDWSHLTTEEKFISRVLEIHGVKDVTAEQLKVYVKRLAHLVQLGFKPYELVEYPKVLQLTEDEISARRRRIEVALAAGADSPALAMLKFALPSKRPGTLQREVASYLNKRGKNVNLLRDVADALDCTSDVMMEILARNPRLVGVKPRKDLVEKIQLLRSCGARLEDLRRSTNILNNKLFGVIKNRAEQLVELGLNDPLPLGYIGLGDAQFSAVIDRLSREQRDRSAAISTTDVSRVVDNLPPFSCRKLVKVKPKIEYLLSEGYTPAEVIKFPKILDLNLSSLKSTISELMQYSIVRVDLDLCYQYANNGQFSKSRVFIDRQIADVLGCSRKEIPQLPRNYYNSSLIGIDVMRTNCQFLLSCGFKLADLRSVPLVLLHPVEAVRQNLNELNNPSSRSRASEAYVTFSGDRLKQLNLILYVVEKAAGFGNIKSPDADEFSSSCPSDSEKLSDQESCYKYDSSSIPSAAGCTSMYDFSSEDGCIFKDWNRNTGSVAPAW